MRSPIRPAMWSARHWLALPLVAGAFGAARLRPRAGVSPPRAEHWVVPASAPCQGLTIGWAIPAGELRQMLDSAVQPAPGPVPGTGLMLLFVAKCPGSSIAGRSTGPFVSTHVIIPIAAPPAAREAAAHGVKGWIAIPETYGANRAPVRALFARHGFAVEPGGASLQISTGASGAHARLVLETPHGRLTATATLGDSARRFESMTGIVGGASAPLAFAHGPERSMRRSGGAAIVTTDGTTPLSGLHPVGKAVAVLDTRFTWDFTFESESGVGRGER